MKQGLVVMIMIPNSRRSNLPEMVARWVRFAVLQGDLPRLPRWY